MRVDGPDAERMGSKDSYPSCIEAIARMSCRVGTWSGNHRVQRSVPVNAAELPSALVNHPSPPPVTWRWGLFSQSIDDFLDKTKTTGLLILKDGQVVAERYQYDRKPDMPMRSFSMAKTVTALLIGIAHDKGLITSLDDLAAVYWPEIAGSAYAQTSIRDLLRMSSGVPFRELYTWTPDVNRSALKLICKAKPHGKLMQVQDFTTPPLRPRSYLCDVLKSQSTAYVM
ncbi:MAG: class A beta-lactamase-related serine hydrolase [Betaproteobacteria bacterium]|nr:class A beta-lactamase-related serine hydrolase [Betaproteobacteria bacterium]